VTCRGRTGSERNLDILSVMNLSTLIGPHETDKVMGILLCEILSPRGKSAHGWASVVLLWWSGDEKANN
jgi:hypothetical protein